MYKILHREDLTPNIHLFKILAPCGGQKGTCRAVCDLDGGSAIPDARHF